jgi:hypothetical protein
MGVRQPGSTAVKTAPSSWPTLIMPPNKLEGFTS